MDPHDSKQCQRIPSDVSRPELSDQRRRVQGPATRHYPSCSNCQFREQDERPVIKDETPILRGAIMDKIFKAYDIRGTYPDQLNEETAWRIGHATANFFRSQLSGYARSDPKFNVLAVGRDMRKSSPSLLQAFIDGVLSAGVNVHRRRHDRYLADLLRGQPPADGRRRCRRRPATTRPSTTASKSAGPAASPSARTPGLQEIKRIAQAVPPRSSVPQAQLTTARSDAGVQGLRPQIRQGAAPRR